MVLRSCWPIYTSLLNHLRLLDSREIKLIRTEEGIQATIVLSNHIY